MSDTPRTDAAKFWIVDQFKIDRLVVQVQDMLDLERELAPAQKDAARYRWLRDSEDASYWRGDKLYEFTSATEIDAAIDTAMNGE